jgi:PAS domain S-box-containing protein
MSHQILIIEDNPEQARLMQEILHRSSQPYRVDVRHNAETGLDQLDRESYDAVLLDYHLPPKTGIEVLQIIKDHQPQLPVIMVTGQGDERIAVQAMREGAYDYIVKTRDYLDLLPRVLGRAIQERHLSSRLKQSEQRYFALFDKASVAILIASADDYRLLQVNKSAEELIGLPAKKLLDYTFLQLCSRRSREPVYNFIHEIHEKGQASTDQIVLLRVNQHPVPSDVNGSLVEIGDRKVLQLFVRDISETVKMQKQVLLSRQRLVSVFDGITDLISVQDQEHNLIMGNKRYSEFAHRNVTTVNGEKCFRALFGQSTPCENCPAPETFKTGDSKFVEIFHQGRTFHIWTYPMAGLDGRPEFLVEYAKDVTEQKEIEKQLIKSEKLASIGLLSSGIAHELRNPLNIIETARYSLEDALDSEKDQVTKRLTLIKKNVRRASIIIDNLLQFSRHSPYEKEPVDVSKLIDNTLSLLDKEIGIRNIFIKKHDDGVARVFFSLDSLKQVFLNLILNAVQAMPDGGTLSIKTDLSSDGNWVFIHFIDTGVGISEDNLKHIFTPFFSTKLEHGGTGLGLYLSYTILKREGGDILVTSHENEGSTFTIKVPVAKDTDVPFRSQHGSRQD